MTPHNFTLSEIARYMPGAIDPETLADVAAECEEWRDSAGDCHIYSPKELSAYLEECASPDQKLDLESERDQYKEFFDCVLRALEDTNGAWPGAEPYQLDLQNAVSDSITQGADAIRLIESFLAGDSDREDLLSFFKEVTR